MSSTCFEPEVSSSGRRLCLRVWYCVFYMHQYVQFCRLKCVCLCAYMRVVDGTHSSTYYSAYTDASKTNYTMPVYTTVFLKMNTRLRNKLKTEKSIHYFKTSSFC